jgi:ribonucleoside-diphosphate reductase alpha chain
LNVFLKDDLNGLIGGLYCSVLNAVAAYVEVIKQGGKRRGAQMGTLHVWHPDVRKFIKAKIGELKDALLQNLNISVFVDGTFTEKALGTDNDPKYLLINPRMSYDKRLNTDAGCLSALGSRR